jgi:hypothetical protein
MPILQYQSGGRNGVDASHGYLEHCTEQTSEAHA